MRSEPEPACPHCNHTWTEHPGVQGACRELQRARQCIADVESLLTTTTQPSEALLEIAVVVNRYRAGAKERP